MDTNQWVALLGGVIVALVIRLSNMLIQFLSRILNVNPPEPIPSITDMHSSVDTPGPTVIQPQSEATDPPT